jgi:hypothetical protein
LDGVKRGHTTVRKVTNGVVSEEGGLIFVFYKDFDVTRTLSGRVMCGVKFIVLTTLDRKLNNLSFRLKWPDMETALNYMEVPPNQEMYYDYTLLGEGCYSMDKIPNIIVNRCRVKGLTQQECAAKIRWIKMK